MLPYKKCPRNVVASGNVPKALAVATIPPQENIPSGKWSLGNRLLQFLADTSDGRGLPHDNDGSWQSMIVKHVHDYVASVDANPEWR